MAEPRAIQIRRVTAGDAVALAHLMADPAVQPNLMQLPYTNEAAWRKRLEDQPPPGQPDVQLLAERPDDSGQMVMVGQAGFNAAGLAVRRRHVVSMGIAVAPSAQGQGVGTALMQALCDYADQWAAILRIELQVFADNAGKSLSAQTIRAAFDESFGAGAGARVTVSCSGRGPGRWITEVVLSLAGDVTGASALGDLLRSAQPISAGCPGGLVASAPN